MLWETSTYWDPTIFSHQVLAMSQAAVRAANGPRPPPGVKQIIGELTLAARRLKRAAEALRLQIDIEDDGEVIKDTIEKFNILIEFFQQFRNFLEISAFFPHFSSTSR